MAKLELAGWDWRNQTGYERTGFLSSEFLLKAHSEERNKQTWFQFSCNQPHILHIILYSPFVDVCQILVHLVSTLHYSTHYFFFMFEHSPFVIICIYLVLNSIVFLWPPGLSAPTHYSKTFSCDSCNLAIKQFCQMTIWKVSPVLMSWQRITTTLAALGVLQCI